LIFFNPAPFTIIVFITLDTLVVVVQSMRTYASCADGVGALVARITSSATHTLAFMIDVLVL